MKGAGIQIRFRNRAVLWTDYPDRSSCDFSGFSLRRNDGELKREIARMLRRMPKRWDRYKGRTAHIFNLPGVSCSWY